MTTLAIRPVDGGSGHDPRSVYCELFWLPTIGPSTLLLARRLVTMIDGGIGEVDDHDLAAMLGLGRDDGAGNNTPFARTLRRLGMFHLGSWQGDTVFIRVAWPSASPGMLTRMPVSLTSMHRSFLQGVS